MLMVCSNGVHQVVPVLLSSMLKNEYFYIITRYRILDTRYWTADMGQQIYNRYQILDTRYGTPEGHQIPDTRYRTPDIQQIPDTRYQILDIDYKIWYTTGAIPIS